MLIPPESKVSPLPTRQIFRFALRDGRLPLASEYDEEVGAGEAAGGGLVSDPHGR